MNHVKNVGLHIQEAHMERGKSLPITERRHVRRALIYKHGDLTKAAEDMAIDYLTLSHVINGRRCQVNVINAIQHDLNLTDDQVLNFWPLLRSWPKEKSN